VAGFRGKGFQLYLFTADDDAGARWTRHVLDAGGMAAADCKIADFDGDGQPEIVCAGASTGNVKLYKRQRAAAGALNRSSEPVKKTIRAADERR
jgi:hypothetical protein